MKEKSVLKNKTKQKTTLCRWAGGCGTTSEWEATTLPQPALPSHGCGSFKSAVSLARPTLCSLSRARLSLGRGGSSASRAGGRTPRLLCRVPGLQQDRVFPCPHRGCGDRGARLARS